VAEAAQLLSKSPLEAGQTAASLQSTLQNEQWAIAPCRGYMSKASWPDQLSFLTQAGLHVSGQKYSYSNLVDMSFYNAAVNTENDPSLLTCTG
jgi:hypothetical protein